MKYKDGRVASKQLTSLMGTNCFTNPKDVDLLQSLFKAVAVEDNDIILDFFSGSGTTAEAALRLSASGKNVHFIAVQWEENLDLSLEKTTGSGKQVIKNAINLCDSLGVPHTVDQIGIERIIRAGTKIREEHPDTTADLGFKHFTLKEPAAETLDKLEAFSTLTVSDEILSEFGLPTVLTTWLVHDGYGFTAPVQEIDFAGYKGYFMNKHLYLIGPNLTDAAIEAIVSKYEADGDFNPENVVMFGYSFFWTELEALKTNLKRLKDTEKNLRINFDIRY